MRTVLPYSSTSTKRLTTLIRRNTHLARTISRRCVIRVHPGPWVSRFDRKKRQVKSKLRLMKLRRIYNTWYTAVIVLQNTAFMLHSSIIRHPYSFVLRPSSFVAHPSPSSFVLHPSSFICLCSLVLHISSFNPNLRLHLSSLTYVCRLSFFLK